MAKKRKRIDYDSPLMSIYSPEYQYLMRQNAPENANTFEGSGPMGPTYDREFYNDGLVGTERITSPQIQMQNLVNTTAQNQYNQDIANMKSTGQAISQQQSTQPSTGSNVNWGGIIGTAATATANAISNGGSAADIAANALGIPVLAKMWKANTEKGDANIKSAQEAIASVQDNKYIQDANSLQGVGNALKLNMSNKPKMIDTSGFQRMTNWKDFSSGRGSGSWWKNMATAQLQGAAAGSVGGPWGALGGATVGLLGSIGGLFGAKKRAKKAMKEYNQRMDSLRAYATAENLRRKTDYELSNQNAIHNGLGQQSIKEMANFHAFGGNLYPDGGNIEPYYPKSSDPDAVNWLSDWYSQRPNQVQNTFGNNHNLSFTQINPNMNETYYGETNVPKERSVNYSLLTYPTEEEYNKNLYKNLIDRAAASSNIFSENMWEGAGGTYSNDGTHFVQNPNFDPHYNDWLMQQWKAGNYVDMDESKNTPETLISGDNYKNTIMYNWNTMNDRNDGMSTRIHERTHSMVTDPLLNSIDTGLQNAINNRVKLKKDFNREHYGNNDAYWDDPNEIYSRMNEFRYESGLKGSDNVDQKFLNDNRKLLEEKGLDRYTDESLLKLFNEVAYNNTNNYNNIAAMGGQFDIGLSPNMMNLWNDKQNIDKQKIMNQQMNFGLGNSFNTKLNMFDLGGYANIDTDADGYSEDYSTQQVQEPNVYEQEKYEDLYGNDYDNIDQNKQNYYNNYPYAYGGNLNRFDYGGSMNGMNLPTDMQYYENGGTHEQNPNGGIQVGQDQQGNPNLVEEGEFRYGDYIFSDRIPVDYNILSDFNAGKSKGNRNTKNNPTYAELAKKTADKYKDLNDEISKNSLNKQLDRLQQSQEAQKFKEQQDQQYADYKNTLKSPTQGNPMYGNMKYNGIGNANQGVNIGVDEGMSNAMDNSDLSNVNRSGNPMMAAYGGNIYKDGDEMSFIIPKSLLGSVRTPSLSYSTPTLNNFSSFVDVNSDKNINNNQSYEYLNNYFTPNQVADLRESYGLSRAGGIDTPFVKNVQKMIGARRNGIFDDKSQLALNKFANYPTEDVVNPNNSQYGTTQGNSFGTSTSTKVATKTPTQFMKDENTSDENIKTINGNESSVNNTMAVSGKGPQEPVEVDYNLGRHAAGISDYTDPTVPMYNDNGYWANLAKGIMPNLMNWSGQANWEFDPDWRPEIKLEALGKTAYRDRIADHLGDYIAPNLMDIERLNNAAMAQTAANARGVSNIGGGNRGFVSSQMAANDYNGQMGIGNNYVTANQYNTDQLFKSAEFNKAINQFNATANNEAWRDNLNSWLQGKNMEINALVQANQARNQKALYEDRTNRDAALNRSSDLGAMADNMINTVVDNALYNRGLNNINTKLNNRYYLDKDKGWTYKGDTGIGRQINEYAKGVRLTSDDYTQINNILKEDPHNIAGIEGIIDARRAEQDKQDIKDFNDKHNSIIADFDNYSSLLDDALFGDIYKNENRLAFNKARDEYEEVINNKKSTSSQKEQAYNNFRNKVNQMKDKYALYKGMVYSQRNKSFDLTPEEYATLYEKRQKDNKSAYGDKINTRKHREYSYTDI